MKQITIKFRVWDNLVKEMINNPYLNIEKGILYPNYGLEEIMQYTGLADKNGVEIYEGDLVQNPSGRICKIEYRLPMAGYDFIPVARTENTNADYFMSYYVEHLEVIGNIYQNPELLAEPNR